MATMQGVTLRLWVFDSSALQWRRTTQTVVAGAAPLVPQLSPAEVEAVMWLPDGFEPGSGVSVGPPRLLDGQTVDAG